MPALKSATVVSTKLVPGSGVAVGVEVGDEVGRLVAVGVDVLRGTGVLVAVGPGVKVLVGVDVAPLKIALTL